MNSEEGSFSPWRKAFLIDTKNFCFDLRAHKKAEPLPPSAVDSAFFDSLPRPSPLQVPRGGHTRDPLEHVGEVQGIVEARQECHVLDGVDAVVEQGAGVVDSLVTQVFRKAHPHLPLEQMGEVLGVVGEPPPDGRDGQLVVVEFRLYDTENGGHRLAPGLLLGAHAGQGVEEYPLGGQINGLG